MYNWKLTAKKIFKYLYENNKWFVEKNWRQGKPSAFGTSLLKGGI